MRVPNPETYGYRAIVTRSDRNRGQDLEVTLTLSPIRNGAPLASDIPSTVAHKSPENLRRSLSILLGSPWDADLCIERASSGEAVECWLLPQRWTDALNQLRPRPLPVAGMTNGNRIC
jgi:hypothetical protein